MAAREAGIMSYEEWLKENYGGLRAEYEKWKAEEERKQREREEEEKRQREREEEERRQRECKSRTIASGYGRSHGKSGDKSKGSGETDEAPAPGGGRLAVAQPDNKQKEEMQAKRIKELETEISNLTSERLTMQKRLDESKTHAMRVKELETEVQDLEMRLGLCRSDHEKKEGIQAKKIVELETEMTSLTSDQLEMQKRFEESKTHAAMRSNQLETKVRNLEARLGLCRSDHEQKEGKQVKRIKELEIEISKLTSERLGVQDRPIESNAKVRELESILERNVSNRGASERTPEMLVSSLRSDDSFREYSLREVKAATNNFDDDSKLEEQEHGDLYIGKMMTVTVKRLRADREMCGRHVKLTQEMVDRLRSLRHPHLQTLLGVCYEENCLVYEHMAKGNVKEWISCPTGQPRRFLPWYTRLRIMADVARALSFLHSSESMGGGPIIHHAIKPQNISLDDNFVAKLGDVDVVLLSPTIPKKRQALPRDRSASLGSSTHYIAPEYFRAGIFDEKTNIYSFGITLLEMLSGNFEDAFDLQIIEEAVENPMELSNVLDPHAGSWDIYLALKAARLGLLCASLDRRNRPSMMAGEGAILPILEEIASKVELTASLEGLHG